MHKSIGFLSFGYWHHFAQQLSAPFPPLAAAAARTSRIDLGTGVIDMRYENPLYMARTPPLWTSSPLGGFNSDCARRI